MIKGSSNHTSYNINLNKEKAVFIVGIIIITIKAEKKEKLTQW